MFPTEDGTTSGRIDVELHIGTGMAFHGCGSTVAR
jgi:hypothetical protein